MLPSRLQPGASSQLGSSTSQRRDVTVRHEKVYFRTALLTFSLDRSNRSDFLDENPAHLHEAVLRNLPHTISNFFL